MLITHGLLVVTALLSGSAPPSQDTLVVVQGRVVDYVTGDALKSVQVTPAQGGAGTLTDENGRFRLQVPWPETLGLELSQLGYQPASFPLEGIDKVTGLEIRLPPNPILLEGLEAVVDRFEVRRRKEGRKVYVWEPDRIVRSGGGNLWELIRREVPFSRPCRLNRDLLCRYGRSSIFSSRFASGPFSRSQSALSGSLAGETQVSICINGRPALAGAGELRGYPLDSVYRIEFVGVFANSVRVWTRDYMQLMVAGEAWLPRMDPRQGC
jgi:hypothetical protein